MKHTQKNRFRAEIFDFFACCFYILGCSLLHLNVHVLIKFINLLIEYIIDIVQKERHNFATNFSVEDFVIYYVLDNTDNETYSQLSHPRGCCRNIIAQPDAM